MDQLMEQGGIAVLAELCHEANRKYRELIGENPGPCWKDAPVEMVHSTMNGVHWRLMHPDASPSAQHEEWYRQKLADGWQYGPLKDPEARLHPCMVEYAKLPIEQRTKDYIFICTIAAAAPVIQRTVTNLFSS